MLPLAPRPRGRDPAGRLITTTLPNGVTTFYTYDPADRITRLTHSRSNGTIIVGDYRFVSDGAGNRTVVTEVLAMPSAPNVTTTLAYTYDPLYRLTSASYSGTYTYTFAYAYDQVGNRMLGERLLANPVTEDYEIAAVEARFAVQRLGSPREPSGRTKSNVLTLVRITARPATAPAGQ